MFNKNWKYIFNIDNLINESKIFLTNSQNNYDEIINTKIINNNTAENIINLLAINIIDFDSFYSIVELYNLVKKSKKFIIVKKLFDQHNNYIKNNYKLYDQLIILKKIYSGSHEKKSFINNFIHRYFKNGSLDLSVNNNTMKINNYITKLQNQLENDKNSFTLHFNVDPNNIHKNMLMREIPSDKFIQFDINHFNYNYISSLLINSIDRNKLENLYYDNSNYVMKKFAKILILQHEFAKKNGSSNYGEFIYNKNTNDYQFIINVLKNIIDNLSPNIINLFKLITNNLQQSFISQIDVNYWFFHKKNIIKFSPNSVIQLFINVVKNIFGLNINISSNVNDLWHNSIIQLNVFDEKFILLGNIYLDLVYRKNKITCPHTVILDTYNELSSTLPSISIIAGYTSLSEKILSINDALYLFKQFGQIIHYVCHKSKFGILNVSNADHEFCNLMTYLMEYIFWNKNNLEILCKENLPSKETNLTFTNNIIDELIYINNLEKIHSLFFSSIDSLFDLLIHSSNSFVDICKDLIKDENNLHLHINKLYFNLYDNIVDKFKSYFKYNQNGVNPLLLNKIIDGNICTIYNNVFNNITAFNLFNLIAEKNNGIIFRKNVLENNNHCFKNLLNNFFTSENSQYNIFNLSLFLNNFNKNTDYFNLLYNTKSKINTIRSKINCSNENDITNTTILKKTYKDSPLIIKEKINKILL